MPKLNIRKLAEAQVIKKAKNDENGENNGEIDEKAQKTAGNVCKSTISYHKMRRITSELNLEETLPWHFEPGTAYHVISQGDVDSLTYLRVIIKQQKLKYLILSTWCMAITDIEEIASWIEKKYINRVDFYVGEIFTSRYAKEFVILKNLL